MSSIAGLPDSRADQLPPRRVRHEVRDGAVLMAFSAAVSCGAAGGLLLLSKVLG
ncbi:hypothetical protein KLP28_02260 [Nocardioidaceae bacterium]|nr:hypothetical protein KLP28_02260 [Nocardioidaceae bacterium]